MTKEANPRRSGSWPWWIALVLLGLALAVMAGGGIKGSQAQTPPDVQVAKAANVPSVVPGQAPAPLYTVTFTNASTVDVIINTITDTLPPGFQFLDMHPSSDWHDPPDDDVEPEIVWQGPITIPASAELRLVYAVDVPLGVPRSTTPYVNSVMAMVGGTSIGPASAAILVGGPQLFLPAIQRNYAVPAIVLSKSASPAEVTDLPGEEVIYTVLMTNAGTTEPGTTLTVYDTLPAGFTYLGMTADSDVKRDPDRTTGTITWTGPWTLAPHGQMKIQYRVSPSQVIGTHTNLVNATTDQTTLPPLAPASSTITVRPGILLEEDFNAGIDRWTPFLNYWRLKPGQWYWGQTDGFGGSGALTQDCNDVGDAEDALMMYLADGAEAWTDYRVETKIILRTKGYPHGLWVRGKYKDSEVRAQWVTGYYVVIGGKQDGANHYVSLRQLQTETDCWDQACQNPQNLYNFNNTHELTTTQKDGSLARDRWYTLAVEVRGNRIKAWLDGVLYIDYVDTKEPFLSGTVGFKTYKADTVSFDDLTVTPLR